MDLNVEWLPPVPLVDGTKQRLIYTCDLEKLPIKGGVYVFARRFGQQVEALYVGRAESIRRRIKSQLKNLPLMKHVEGARIGRRVLFVGEFKPKPGQKARTCLPVIERALIRYFLTERHDLVNVHGAKLRQHTITSAGSRRMVPKTMFIDR